jgi:hypothetical protein
MARRVLIFYAMMNDSSRMLTDWLSQVKVHIGRRHELAPTRDHTREKARREARKLFREYHLRLEEARIDVDLDVQ